MARMSGMPSPLCMVAWAVAICFQSMPLVLRKGVLRERVAWEGSAAEVESVPAWARWVAMRWFSDSMADRSRRCAEIQRVDAMRAAAGRSQGMSLGFMESSGLVARIGPGWRVVDVSSRGAEDFGDGGW